MGLSAAILCLAALAPAVARAAPQWAETPYEYVVLDQDIRSTLTDFGRNLGMAVSLSDGVKGRVWGRIDADSAGGFLDRLAEQNGLNWYFDGAVLHVSAAGEYATRVIPTGGLRGNDVIDQMQRLDLADDRFGMRGGTDIVTVSGPPAYVAVVRDLVQNMQPVAAIPDGDDPRVRVFRGRIGSEDVAVADPEP